MKRLLLITCLVMLVTTTFAQDENETSEENKAGKFKTNNIFIGGSINLGFGNRSFAIGAVPEIGYSITKWLDAGVAANLNYQTQRVIDFNSGATIARVRAFNYGGGVFARIWPVNFLHIAVQPEYNWIKFSWIDENSNQKTTETYKAESLLVGLGYGGREIGSRISYITIMIDLAKNMNSPYRDQYNRAQPVIRTGFGFYLGRGRR